jgi:cell division protein FtsW (lipid II flippase)
VETGNPRRWIGRWVVAVALLHAVGAVFIYAAPLREMAGAGLIATADDYSLRATAYWFFAFAPVLAVLGLLVDAMEARRIPVPFGAALLLLLTLIAMVAVMPANGAWLLFPPVIALLLRARRS